MCRENVYPNIAAGFGTRETRCVEANRARVFEEEKITDKMALKAKQTEHYFSGKLAMKNNQQFKLSSSRQEYRRYQPQYSNSW
jgi:hypothetical protein